MRDQIDEILDAIACPVIVYDSNHRIERLNSALTVLSGYTRQELVGKSLAIWVSADAIDRRDLLVAQDSQRTSEASIRSERHALDVGATRRDQEALRLAWSVSTIDADDRLLYVATIQDRTTQIQQEAELLRYLQDLENARAQSETNGERVVELAEDLAAEKENFRTQALQLQESERELNRYVLDLEMTRSQFEKQAAEMVWLAEQLHAEKQQVEESRKAIEYQAKHDALTGLGNRSLLQSVLPKMISEAEQTDTKVGLIYIDLDNFKAVNDRLGHEAGDHVLCTVADALRSNLRETDTATRHGGDEFAVLVSLKSDRKEEHLKELAERLRKALSITVAGPDFSVATGASIGLAIFPNDGRSLDALLMTADSEMYRAKRANKATLES